MKTGKWQARIASVAVLFSCGKDRSCPICIRTIFPSRNTFAMFPAWEVCDDEFTKRSRSTALNSHPLKQDKADVKRIGRYFQTATAVLRLAVALSNGDISLAEATRFHKLKRSERRLLLGLLEQCHPIVEDMLRYKERWILLGEILHPSEYKHRYARCEEAFDILRNNKPFTAYNASVELAFQSRQIWHVIDMGVSPCGSKRGVGRNPRPSRCYFFSRGRGYAVRYRADYGRIYGLRRVNLCADSRH